jgi:hypothetical protein
MSDLSPPAVAGIVVGIGLLVYLVGRWRRAARAKRDRQREHYQMFYGGTVEGVRARVDVAALTELKRAQGGMAVVIVVRNQDPDLPLDVIAELAKSL